MRLWIVNSLHHLVGRLGDLTAQGKEDIVDVSLILCRRDSYIAFGFRHRGGQYMLRIGMK